MKKLTLLKSMLLLCALVVGSTSVWAKQYKKVTSASELVHGNKYLIVSVETNNKYYALSKSSSNNRNVSEVTVDDDIINVDPATGTSDTTPYEIILLKNGEKWNLYDAVNAKYLNGGYISNNGAGSPQNKLITDTSVSSQPENKGKDGVFTIVINTTTGVATITNQNSFTVKYNSGSSLIATYTSGQKDVCLYREVTGPTAASDKITWDFSSPSIGTVTANQTNTLIATNLSSTMTYVAGKSCTISSGYLKPGGKSTMTGASAARYFILHIENSGTLSITSNSADGKQGTYNIYQGPDDDIAHASLSTTITTSTSELTKSGDIDILDGEYVFIGWTAGTYYTEKIQWSIPNELILTTTDNMAGWRTFYDATQDYEVDANTTIYTVASKTGESKKVELTAAAGKIIPGNTPVILKTTAGNHKIVLTKTETDADLGDNLLKAATGMDDIDGYRLGYGNIGGDNAVGFFKYAGTPAAGTVYIDSGDVTTSARELGIGFGDDVTAINKVEAKKVENGVFYNLAGQQVAQPTKGLYIVNGKKVVLK